MKQTPQNQPQAQQQIRRLRRKLTGSMLYTIPGRLIVQRWRSCEFYDTDLDSLLILRFVQDGKRGRIDLVHANVPRQDHAGVTQGWQKYYWKPLRTYLKKLAV